MTDGTRQNAYLADSMRAERLRRWVILLGVLFVVGNCATDAYDQWRAYRFAIDDTSRELVNTARILASQAEGTLKSVDVLLRDAADGYPHMDATVRIRDTDAMLAGRVEGLSQVLSLKIADAQGVIRYRSGPLDKDRAVSLEDRSYFTALRDNPILGLVISEPIVTKIEHRTSIALVRRLRDDSGRFAGVVNATIDLDKFQQFYHQINLGSHSAIVLLHDDGTLLAREPPALDRIGKSYRVLVARLSAEPAVRMVSPVDGVARFIAGAHVDGFPLIVTVGREEAAVLARWRGEVVRVAVQDLIVSAVIGLAIAALVHQLTRVERGERALRESEERYALAMEGANEGHFDRDLHADTAFMSPKMRELLGVGPDVPMNTHSEALVNVHPDDRSRINSAFEDLLERRTDRYEVEYRTRHADGEWRWILVRGRSLRDSAGRPYRLVGSAIDITERKRAEAEKDRLEVQLRKSQKLEAMGTLAGGIAHDFNNILGAILGYGELAQKSAAPSSAVRRYIDNVMHAAGRAKALVERILAFSRSGVGDGAPVNVQAAIGETLDLLAPSLPGRVQLMRQLDAGDAAVIADATLLHQVVMNLCTNAVQAMPAGGVLEVRLERADVRERRSVFHGELVPGPYVWLTVRDTGTGIEPRILDRMFDPFFTTKGVGAGTGLGLSLVHGIIADVGGAIDVATKLDEGTTFTIWLPVAGSAPPPAAEVANELPHGNGEVVMVIDDEPSLVELTEEMLAQIGYEPVGFESAPAALKAFADDPRRFDLVLTDEMMPELTGTGLALEIHRIRSDIPILIMSGYVNSIDNGVARSAGVTEILRKPLKSRDIAEALARALGPVNAMGANANG